MKKSAALLFLSLIVMSMGGCGNSQNVPTQQPAENTTTQTAPSQSTAQTSEPQSTAQPDTTQQQKNASGKISLAMYEQIDTGMRYEDVVALIGAKPSSESTMDLMGATTVMCSWWGEGDIGANAMIYFQDGVVSSKSQAGLK